MDHVTAVSDVMDTNLFSNRRSEVEREVARLKQTLAEYEAELAELDIAIRLVARLTGAKRDHAGTSAERQPETVRVTAPAGEPPLTEKIQAVLAESYRQGRVGLEPSEIYEAILAKGWFATKDNVRTTTWRIWKDGRLSKVGETSMYTVPNRETVADETSLGETSATVNETSMRPVEPEPGGGA